MEQAASRQLPSAAQEAIAAFPEYKMGVHRITVELRDGSVFADVNVAWESEIVRVAGSTGDSIRPQ